MSSRTTAPASGTTGATGEGREVLRLVPPVILWWVWVAFAAVNAVDFGIQGVPSARFGAVVSAILLLVTGLMFTLALRPRVICDRTGLTVVNPFRVHQVPWRVIQVVEAGEWVRVHYAAVGPAVGAAAGGAAAGGAGLRQRGSTVHCWALYVSAGARRKAARPARRAGRGPFSASFAAQWANADAGPGTGPGYAQPTSRLPAEARYLASLPPAIAMAARLDARAARERAAPERPGETPATAGTATVNWSLAAVAAVVIPALILLVTVLA